jgi:uncharacterized protein YggT (Ycf19 family)
MRTLLPITFLVNLVFSVIELLLGVRLVLRLFGANPNTPFVEFIYDATAPLLAPFAGIFPNPELREGSVLEIQTLIALLVYGLIAYMVTYLIDYLNARVTDSTTAVEDDDVEERVVRRRRR